MKFVTPSGSYKLERIPQTQKGDLRAWDAADELLLHTFLESHDDKNTAHSNSKPILIINDSFGALSLALHKNEIYNWSDSYLSHLAVNHNKKLNGLSSSIHCIASNEELEGNYQYVLIKIPKTLALLEDQLYRLKQHIKKDTVLIAAAMSKHIHTSTLKLFEKIIGTTTTSRAVKKARLIFASNDHIQKQQSPYPKIIKEPSLNLHLSNHANVFAKDHLDIGTRFFIQQLKRCPSSENIIDLGCGNGALGIIMQRYQPQAQLHFIDESYMAIASAKENYLRENPDSLKNNSKNGSKNNATFTLSNCLSQFSNTNTIDLILCNPPFHQSHSIGDQIAWQMFKQSHQRLQKNGELWIVGNRHLNYHAKLKRLFGNCKTIASNKKFVVLAAIKK